MTTKYYDIIIIGSGISGLYSAYNIKNVSHSTSFLVLEKYKKNWIGGRTSNETFYGSQIVTGAGIGRLDTNTLLIKLLKKLNIEYTKYNSIMNYSKTMNPVDIVKIIEKLKIEYKNHPELHNKTFKQFFIKTLGNELYKKFIMSAGYTDYEDADIAETLYNYGMEDNKSGWTGLHIPWKKLVDKFYDLIGHNHFRFSSNVIEIKKVKEEPCTFLINLENGEKYLCNRVIIATTIDTVKNLLPNYKIYNQIKGQPFLRLYAKFDKKSTDILKNYVSHYTIVPGPLQKIIPINHNKGIYMIAYSDNDNAVILKDNLKNTPENRELFSELVEKSLGIHEKLHIIAIKDFYWPIGTHYYTPLNNAYSSRQDFLYKAQHPQKGMLVVGEAFSRYQGWVEGALESVETVLNKKWIENMC